MDNYDAMEKLTLPETLTFLTHQDLVEFFVHMEYPPLELVRDVTAFLQNQIDVDELEL